MFYFLSAEHLVQYAQDNNIDLSTKKISYINGCSNTAGEEILGSTYEMLCNLNNLLGHGWGLTQKYNYFIGFNDPFYSTAAENLFPKTYGTIYAKETFNPDFIVYNPRCGNDQESITSKTITSVLLLKKYTNNIQVIAGLTSPFRFNYFCSFFDNYEFYRQICLTTMFENSEDDKYHLDATELFNYHKQLDLDVYLDLYTQNVLNLYYFLTSNDISFIITPTFTITQRCEGIFNWWTRKIPSIFAVQNKISKIRSFADFTAAHNFPRGKNHHPLTKAHAEYANFLLSKDGDDCVLNTEEKVKYFLYGV